MGNDATLPKEEKLLRYQEVFHHFYRKDELNALINLSAGFATNTISPGVQSNQLLLGALYNSYGLPNLGEPLLQQVAAKASRDKVKDLAWFYMAKEHYKEDSFGKLENAIKRVGGSLDQAEQNERQYMLGMFFIKQRDYVKAEAALSQLGDDSEEYQFLLFNLGAAYLKGNNVEKGVKYLTQVGNLDQKDETLLSLKDKANVVLGYQYLRAGQSELARGFFEKIRLRGAFSEKALLGLGWAYSQVNDYRRALVPWLMLSEQDPTHIEVQEVLMAVPYTYNELGSQKKSVELYRESISKYEEVKKDIDDAIGFVESASLFGLLFVNNEYDDYAISKQLKANLNTDLGKMLFELLKEKEIQVMLDEYRDLLQLKSETAKWRDSLELMNKVLGTVEDSNELSDFSHTVAENGVFDALPDKVAKKIKYKEKLLTLGSRVVLQSERLDILLEKYEQNIRSSVLKELNKRNQFVITYLSQTRYSLAELLDKSQRGK